MHGYDHIEEDNVENVDDVPAIFDVFPCLLLQLNQFNQEVGYESNRTYDQVKTSIIFGIFRIVLVKAFVILLFWIELSPLLCIVHARAAILNVGLKWKHEEKDVDNQ